MCNVAQKEHVMQGIEAPESGCAFAEVDRGMESYCCNPTLAFLVQECTHGKALKKSKLGNRHGGPKDLC